MAFVAIHVSLIWSLYTCLLFGRYTRELVLVALLYTGLLFGRQAWVYYLGTGSFIWSLYISYLVAIHVKWFSCSIHTWVSDLVAIHGLLFGRYTWALTWSLCMGILLGRYTWVSSSVAIHGSLLWSLSMGLLLERYAWVFHLVAIHGLLLGRYARVFYLVAIHGSPLWPLSMGSYLVAIHGSLAWSLHMGLSFGRYTWVFHFGAGWQGASNPNFSIENMFKISTPRTYHDLDHLQII